MPTIAAFFGILIRMYHRDHGPPHIHAIYQGFEALIALEDGRLLQGKLPPKALKLVQDWVAVHSGELAENWKRAEALLPLEQIPGADQDD